MNIQEKIRNLITQNDIVLFMKGTKNFPRCGFSASVVQILYDCQVNDFLDINVLDDEKMRQGIKEFTNWPTIPQLYINGEFIGGSDIVKDMYETGELQKILSHYTK